MIQNKESSRFIPPFVGRHWSFNSSGSQIAAAHGDGHISILDATPGKEIYRLDSAHKSEEHGLIRQADGRRLTSVANGSVKLWELGPPAPLTPFAIGKRRDQDTSYIFSPDGKWLAVREAVISDKPPILGHLGWKVQLIRRENGKVEKEWPPAKNFPMPPLFSADSKKLVLWDQTDESTPDPDYGKICSVIDLATGKEEQRMHMAKLDPLSSGVGIHAAFTPDNRLLAAFRSKSGPQVWDVFGERPLWSAPKQHERDRPVLSSNGANVVLDPNTAAAGTIWEVPSGRKLADFVSENERLASNGPPISPDGRWLVVTPGRLGDNLGLVVRRMPSLEKVLQIVSDN